jgi:SAM-dependent methyltransferase
LIHSFPVSALSRGCNLCGGSAFAPLYEKRGFFVLRCQDCGLVFTHPIPDEESLRATYGREYFEGRLYRSYAEEAGARRADYRKWLAWLARTTGLARGRWLDIGCATGSFLSAARDEGWDACGVDISDYCAGEARLRGLDVRTGTARDLPAEWRGFDVVSMWDTVEHLADPSGDVAAAAARLRPGGWFVASTGDVASLAARLLGRRWWLMLPPVHLYFFSRETLEGVVRKAGLMPVAVRRFGRRLSLGRAVRLLTGAEATSIEGGPSLYFNAFDIMTLLAQRPPLETVP